MGRNKRRSLRRTKSNTKQNVTYLVLIVLLILFFATIGVQLVLKASLFIAGFSDSVDTTQQAEDDTLLAEPTIYDIPDATNSARIKIAGRATKDTILTVFVNGAEQDIIEVEDGEFNSNIRLDTGENTVYVRSENKDRETTRDSRRYTISYLSEKPSLVVDAPQEGEVIRDDEVTVRGATDAGAKVRINGALVVASADGSFNRSVRLSEGENIITVIAEDVAGNTERAEVKVVYEKE